MKMPVVWSDNMQVKCILCDSIEGIHDDSLEAKKFKNHKKVLYLCNNCYDRIGKKTIERHETGRFHLYKEAKKNDLI